MASDSDRAAFVTVTVAARDTPIGHVFVRGRWTPEAVWQPGPSVALQWRDRSRQARDPGKAVAHGFAKVLGTTVTRDEAGTWHVGAGSIPIEVIAGSLHHARYAGLDHPGAGRATRVVAVEDLDQATDVLRIPYVRPDRPVPGVLVSVKAANGVIVELVRS